MLYLFPEKNTGGNVKGKNMPEVMYKSLYCVLDGRLFWRWLRENPGRSLTRQIWMPDVSSRIHGIVLLTVSTLLLIWSRYGCYCMQRFLFTHAQFQWHMGSDSSLRHYLDWFFHSSCSLVWQSCTLPILLWFQELCQINIKQSMQSLKSLFKY